jgi:hypothetical protein
MGEHRDPERIRLRGNAQHTPEVVKMLRIGR